MYIYIYTRTYIYIYMYTHIHTYIYTYIYIYTAKHHIDKTLLLRTPETSAKPYIRICTNYSI